MPHSFLLGKMVLSCQRAWQVRTQTAGADPGETAAGSQCTWLCPFPREACPEAAQDSRVPQPWGGARVHPLGERKLPADVETGRRAEVRFLCDSPLQRGPGPDAHPGPLASDLVTQS